MTTNTDTAYLLTQRIINDLIPKYIEYCRVVDLDMNHYEGHVYTDSSNGVQTQIVIKVIIENINDFKCEFSKTVIRHFQVPVNATRMAEIMRERERQAFLIGGGTHAYLGFNAINPVEHRQEVLEEIDKTFKKKSEAINFISGIVEINHLIDYGLNLLMSLETLNKTENKHIGAIKKILGLNPDADLTSLQTRKILLEIYR